MSEDSDYTSDVNFPLQHQHNSSAHQFRSEHPFRQKREDSRDSQDYRYDRSFDQSFDRGYDRGGGCNERGYERDADYYQDSPYHQQRSDTDSEPLYYNSRPNSRPQSFMVDRWVSWCSVFLW
jgi:hypothetical protein